MIVNYRGRQINIDDDILKKYEEQVNFGPVDDIMMNYYVHMDTDADVIKPEVLAQISTATIEEAINHYIRVELGIL